MDDTRTAAPRIRTCRLGAVLTAASLHKPNLRVCVSCLLTAASSSLRAALQSAELQRILSNIDSAGDRAARLDEYRQRNTDFAAFVEQLLATVKGGTPDKAHATDDVDLDTLLQTLAQASGPST